MAALDWRALWMTCLPPVLGLALVIGLWALATMNSRSFPTPMQTWQAAVALFADPFYNKGPNDQGIGWNVLYSLQRVAVGFGLAAAVGIPMGFIIGRFEFARRMAGPLISLLKPVSFLAWLVIVAAEMLTGGVGIGFWVWDEWNNLNVKHIIVAIVVIGLVGLLLPTSGVLLRDNKEINAPGPERAVVVQNHSLLPWLTCLAKVHLAVERVLGGRENAAQLKERSRSALALVGMEHALHKRPHEISGSMKQRVGIARALAMEPKVLLMDERFGALDALTRDHLQDELLKIVVRTRSTVVMVTHDVDEAVLLSDRIVMTSNGPAATIGEILSNDLPRPRERVALAEDPGYVRCRKQVLEFLYTRHCHVERAA